MGMDGVTAAEARSLGRKKQKQKQTQSICRAMLPLTSGRDSVLMAAGSPAVSTATSLPSCPYELLSRCFRLHVRGLPLGCSNEYRRLSDLRNQGVLGQGGGRLSLVESPLPGSQMVEGLRELSVASFIRLLNTSPRSCLHIFPIGDCSNVQIWGRYKHSVYSIKIPVISNWGPPDSTMTIS